MNTPASRSLDFTADQTHHTFTYKGYVAKVCYDSRDSIYVGRLKMPHDMVWFHASTLEEIPLAMQEAVDDYLTACKQLGREPEQQHHGRKSN